MPGAIQCRACNQGGRHGAERVLPPCLLPLASPHGVPFATAGPPPSGPLVHCNTARGSCYLKNTTSMTYANAAAHCQRLGGTAVGYSSAAEQLEVETALSPASYWLGISRVSRPLRRPQPICTHTAHGVYNWALLCNVLPHGTMLHSPASAVTGCEGGQWVQPSDVASRCRHRT